MSAPEGLTAWVPVLAAAVGALVKGGFDLYMAWAKRQPAPRRGKKRSLRQE